jgi:voltage-gated potassium channel
MINNKLVILFLSIIIFTVFIYIFFNGQYSNCNTFIDHLYFSISSFTFTGFGDIVPITQIAKLVTSIFVLLIFYILILT